MRKGPLCPESLSYQKKDGQPVYLSFGMTTTQDIRDLFTLRRPHYPTVETLYLFADILYVLIFLVN